MTVYKLSRPDIEGKHDLWEEEYQDYSGILRFKGNESLYKEILNSVRVSGFWYEAGYKLVKVTVKYDKQNPIKFTQ